MEEDEYNPPHLLSLEPPHDRVPIPCMLSFVFPLPSHPISTFLLGLAQKDLGHQSWSMHGTAPASLGSCNRQTREAAGLFPKPIDPHAPGLGGTYSTHTDTSPNKF